MKETHKKIIVIIIIIIAVYSIAGFAIWVDNDGRTEIKTLREQQQGYWNEWAKQQSYDTALSEWRNFDCTFDNETLTLETEGYSFGTITITIFSYPVVNISLGYWDEYQTMEKWEERNGEIWIENTDGDVTVIPKDWIIFEKERPNFFELMNRSLPSWSIYTPPNTWTQHIITVHDNISSNLTIVVRRDIEPFNDYNGEMIYRFEPVIYTFEVRT